MTSSNQMPGPQASGDRTNPLKLKGTTMFHALMSSVVIASVEWHHVKAGRRFSVYLPISASQGSIIVLRLMIENKM